MQKKIFKLKDRKVWFAVILVIMISLFFIIKIVLSPKKSKPEYSTYKITEMTPLKLEGNVSYLDTREIFFDASLGKISEINVEDGKDVSKDSPLLTYINTDVQDKETEQQDAVNRNYLQAQQASENLNTATQKYNDVLGKLASAKQKLGSASSDDAATINSDIQQLNDAISQASNEVEQAKQALQLANSDATSSGNMLEQIKNKVTTVVNAPISGKVTVNANAINKADQPVIKIMTQNKNIQGRVTEYDYDSLHVGDSVTVTTVGSGKSAAGKIVSISQAPVKNDNNTATVSYQFNVEGDFPWAEGLSTTISVPINQMVIPSSSVKDENGKKIVYVYKNGKVSKRIIETEDNLGRKIVKSGLKWQDVIISNPDKQLKDAQTIQVASDD